MHDVIIIGGGPVGSHVAYRLAAAGHDVVVLELRPALGKKACCTGIVSRECVNTFAVESDTVLLAVNSARLFSPSGAQLRLWREETQACILDRAAFDTVMARRAQARGAEYLLGSPVSGITVEKDRVKVRVSREGHELDFEGKVVVVASGFGGRLTEALGLGRISDFAIGVQADVETAGAGEIEVYFGHDIAPGFFAWLVPTSPRTARVGLLSRQRPGPYLRRLLSSLRARGMILSDRVKLNYGAVPLKPLPRTYGERLLVAGDAAGQVKPTTGGGIYYGLLCADIAASTLGQALAAGDLSARRLSGYERAWRKRLGYELKVDYWARKLFERLSDERIDRALETIKARGIDRELLEAPELSFDWHSKVILKLMGYRAVSRVVGAIKSPFGPDEN